MAEPDEFAPTALRGVAARLEKQADTLRAQSASTGGDSKLEKRAVTLEGVARRLRARADGEGGAA